MPCAATEISAIQWAQHEGKEANQPSTIAMAFKRQLVILSCLVLQCAADPNASSRLRGANSSVEGGMAKVLTNFTLSTKSGLAAKSANQPEWTAWFSDEDRGSASCNGLISGMECSGRYCDSVRLGCDYSLGSDHVSSRWKGWFSDGDNSKSLCDKGQFVTAVQCKGRYCDDLRLSCASVPSSLVQSNCRWLGWFSDENGKQVFPEGTRLTGLACTGRYCDNLRPYVCNVHQRCIAAGKQQGSWKYVQTIANSGSRHYSYHSTERNSKSSSSEWSKSLTTSVSAGFEYMGASSSVEVSSTVARTQARSLETALEEGYAETQTYTISPESVGLGLWQFEFTAKDTCRHTERIKTHEFIYTDGRFRSPCCLPGYAMGVQPPDVYTCYQKDYQVETASYCRSCGDDGASGACHGL